LASKTPLLPADVAWHFVGPLQRNKVRLVRPAVALLHSLDRKSLAADWIKGKGQPPPALLQVNISHDPAKGGFDPMEVLPVADELVGWGVPVRGVMTIPALSENREETRDWFLALAEIGRRLATTHPTASEVSMGMTDDFELAIESGSTMVRVGRAIFEASY
ncbi:MAG: alanine racemase, partial [Acidimicrobiia bacterium]|nr:alanine racemase [Acidimicrobiia bacterium]